MVKRLLVPFLLSLGILPASVKNTSEHPFTSFLNTFIPKVAEKARQVNRAFWLLETTGSLDAADLVSSLSSELSLLFSDKATYQKLLTWQKENSLTDPLLKRQLQLLVYSFKENSIPEALLKQIIQKQTDLSLKYANFRAVLDGKNVSENDILAVLKTENDPATRQKAWQASKEIGMELAPSILELVALRNESARTHGYDNYFQMQLDLQEVDEKELFTLLDQIALDSDKAYQAALNEINTSLSKRFATPVNELGPWAWSDPFSQQDPVDQSELDSIVAQTDFVEAARQFYQKMGIDVSSIIKQSDFFEKPGKSQHAFCINMDRGSDIRTLNNVRPTIRWFETVLHELGHAIYEMGYPEDLPWRLKEPPHMITTEAMALIAGRRAYLSSSLSRLPTYRDSQKPLIQKAEESLKRRQLIFSRWVLVMTYFERSMYQNPNQDLNALWWSLVAKYQKVTPPADRAGKNDWAAKYHIGLAPVYYYSYLLGEVFASSMEEAILELTGSKDLDTEGAGRFLNEKLFAPGNIMKWSDLVKHVVGKPISSDAWIRQFAEAKGE